MIRDGFRSEVMVTFEIKSTSMISNIYNQEEGKVGDWYSFNNGIIVHGDCFSLGGFTRYDMAWLYNQFMNGKGDGVVEGVKTGPVGLKLKDNVESNIGI